MRKKKPIPWTRPVGWTNQEWYATLATRIPPSVRGLSREAVWEIRHRHRPVGRAGEAPKWDDRLTSKQLAEAWSRRLNRPITKDGIDFLVRMPHELSLAFLPLKAIEEGGFTELVEREREKAIAFLVRKGYEI